MEVKTEATDPAAPQLTQPGSVAEPKKPGRRRSVKVEAAPPVQQTDEERIAQGKRVLGARSKAKALAKAQAEAEAAAQAALAAKRAAERRAQAQRRLEERKRQQLIAEELKKPTEDMCLTDHKVSCVTHSVLCLRLLRIIHGIYDCFSFSFFQSCPVSLVWFCPARRLHTAWLWLSSSTPMES